MQTTYEENQVATVRKWFYDAATVAPQAVKSQVTELSNLSGDVINLLYQYLDNFRSPIKRSEVDIYRKQMDTALEPLLTRMKQVCKEIKAIDNTPYLESQEIFKNVVDGLVKVKERDAKSRLPQNT